MKVYYYFAPWSRLAKDMIISSTPIAGLRLYRVIEVDPNDLI